LRGEGVLDRFFAILGILIELRLDFRPRLGLDVGKAFFVPRQILPVDSAKNYHSDQRRENVNVFLLHF
jgi:hypothetical protein